MSIKRFKGAGIYGSKSNKAWDQTTTLNDFQSIATVIVPSGGQSSVTFSNIPQNFTHLQIRINAQIIRATYGTSNLSLRLNGDTGNNYAVHDVYGNGSGVAADNGASQSQILWQDSYGTSATTNIFGAGIIDILDYANTNKYKTVRSLSGVDLNGTNYSAQGYVTFGSGLWMNTSALTSLTFGYGNGTGFSQYSSFALYGIK